MENILKTPYASYEDYSILTLYFLQDTFPPLVFRPHLLPSKVIAKILAENQKIDQEKLYLSITILSYVFRNSLMQIYRQCSWRAYPVNKDVC